MKGWDDGMWNSRTTNIMRSTSISTVNTSIGFIV